MNVDTILKEDVKQKEFTLQSTLYLRDGKSFVLDTDSKAVFKEDEVDDMITDIRETFFSSNMSNMHVGVNGGDVLILSAGQLSDAYIVVKSNEVKSQ